MRTLLTFRAN